MKLEIAYIKDSGNIEKERTVLKVKQPENLGRYLIAQTHEIDGDRISSSIKNIYWFPDQELKIGDLVVIYTKKGTNTSITNKDGSKTYFYYWGLEKSLNTEDKSCVIIYETSWRVQKVSKD